jgi:hypothetical protein
MFRATDIGSSKPPVRLIFRQTVALRPTERENFEITNGAFQVPGSSGHRLIHRSVIVGGLLLGAV